MSTSNKRATRIDTSVIIAFSECVVGLGFIVSPTLGIPGAFQAILGIPGAVSGSVCIGCGLILLLAKLLSKSSIVATIILAIPVFFYIFFGIYNYFINPSGSLAFMGVFLGYVGMAGLLFFYEVDRHYPRE